MQPFMTLKFKTKAMSWLGRVPLELICWVMALLLLAAAEPVNHLQTHHFTFCPLANIGLKWCPGCGLGRAITQLFHGNLQESIRLHWLGIPAVLLIGNRIIVLFKRELNRKTEKINKEKDYV